MVKCLAPAFGSGDSYVQIVLNPGLPDEVIKTPRSQAGIKWYVLSSGLTRYNASYFNLTPFRFLSNPIQPLGLTSLSPPSLLYQLLFQ